MAKMLIVGFGEIGAALAQVLCDVHDVEVCDVNRAAPKARYDVMHVCFPYSLDFTATVGMYQALHKPTHTVIHSTVPVGTSRKCDAIHSPVIGMHPFLSDSIRAFTKFVGGDKDGIVTDLFRQAGMRTYLFDRPETTELLKLMSTTFYALCIEYTKEVKCECSGRHLPFEAWTLWTQAYNAGYEKLGWPEYRRPNLVPMMKRIGGHCLLENCELLENDFTKLVIERNKQ